MTEKKDNDKRGFAFYLYSFLTENPSYAKEFIHTLCVGFKLVAYGIMIAAIVFAIFSAKYLFLK